MIKYDPKSLKAEEFINDAEINETLKYADEHKDDIELIDKIIEKQRKEKDLVTGRQVCSLHVKMRKRTRRYMTLPSR